MKKIDLPPQLKTGFIILAFASLGCVNRGMVAPPADGDTGMGGHGGGGGTVVDASRDMIGAGGVDGGDSCDMDGGVDGGDGGVVADGGNPSSCTAIYNFESPAGCGLYGAVLGSTPDSPAATAGFTGLHHTPVAFCGRGGMAIDVDFNLTTRTGGEVLLTVSQDGSLSYAGKTLTLSVMGSVDGGPNLRFYVFLVAGGRFQQILVTPITTSWQTLSVALPVPDGSADQVMSISLEAFGRGSPYVGTFYVDEIDVKPTAPDGGSGDVAPSDARPDGDAAAGDVRDAPSGN